MHIRWALAALAGLWLASAPVAASPVTYYFGGTITFDNSPGLAGLNGLGFSGTFTYDPQAPLFDQTIAERRTALQPNALQVTFADGSTAASAGATAGLTQLWDLGISTLFFSGIGDTLVAGAPLGSATGAASAATFIAFEVFDNNNDAGLGSSGDLVPTVLDLLKFEGSQFLLAVAGIRDFTFAAGTLSCLSTSRTACALAPPPTDVAEPGVLSLAGLALAGLIGARRRRPML